MYKVYDYICDCGERKNDVLVSGDDVVKCECGSDMKRLFPCPMGYVDGVNTASDHKFQPFWSDTMQCHIHDRQDLKKLKKYAKDNGLTCIGHDKQKPDKAAIRYNYEN